MKIILSILLFISSTTCFPAQGQYCRDCLAIQILDEIYHPNEIAQISLYLKSKKLESHTVDAHAAVIMPNSTVHFLWQKFNWQPRPLIGQKHLISGALLQDIGHYLLYFILTQPGADPLNNQNWIASATNKLLVLPPDWEPETEKTPLSNQGKLPQVIAHGGGEVAGHRLTNSVEALNRAYAKGQRYIELDFSWTADKRLVLLHDWDINYRRLFLNYTAIPDLKTFSRQQMLDGLTQLTLTGLLDWLKKHADVRIVTDIKSDNLQGLKLIAEAAGDQQHQFVPQIYELPEYQSARNLGYQNIILTLYRTTISDQELLQFVKKKSLTAVTLPLARAIQGNTAMILADAGIYVYVHTVNHRTFFSYLKTRGVKGIYSDLLWPTP